MTTRWFIFDQNNDWIVSDDEGSALKYALKDQAISAAVEHANKRPGELFVVLEEVGTAISIPPPAEFVPEHKAFGR